jgi:hypothetical protein
MTIRAFVVKATRIWSSFSAMRKDIESVSFPGSGLKFIGGYADRNSNKDVEKLKDSSRLTGRRPSVLKAVAVPRFTYSKN